MNTNETETNNTNQSGKPSSPTSGTVADILSPENLAKAIQAKRLSLEVGAGLNYVRPRAKPYYCYRRFKKRMGQRKSGELGEEGESFSAGEGSSGNFSFMLRESESGELPSMVNERELIERRRPSKTSVWNPEVHLYLWERARVYIESYRRNVTVTIHPAILDEEHIKQLLYSDEEVGRECTPLSLNIYLAISLGAHAEGEKQTWLEFWMKSRAELSSLFDETDYNVAVALFLMGCHSFFANDEREKAMYYVILSQTICRRMGYLNSDIYLRGLAFLTFQVRKKPLSVKALRRFQEKMVEMNAQPYYYIPLHGNPKLAKLTNAIVEQAPTGDAAEYLDFQDFLFQNLHNLLAKILFNVATGFALVKLKQRQHRRKEQQVQQYLNQQLQDEHLQAEIAKGNNNENSERQEDSSLTDETREEVDQAFTEELVQKLVALNGELDEKGSSFKTAYLLWVRALAASLIVDVLWNLGDVKRALEMATFYLRAAQSSAFAHTISSIPLLCLPVLNVFLATQNFALLEELMRVLIPLKPRFKPLETMLAPFEERLELFTHESYLYDVLGIREEETLFSFTPPSSSSATGGLSLNGDSGSSPSAFPGADNGMASVLRSSATLKDSEEVLGADITNLPRGPFPF